MAALCQDCDGCCRVFEVKTISKPFGVPCKHLGRTPDGLGCTIYHERPTECERYVCVWLDSQRRIEVPSLPENLRPNVCKVVMGWPWAADRSVMFVYPYPDFPDAWKIDPVKTYLQNILSSGGKVLVFVDSEHVVYSYGTVVMIGTEKEFVDIVSELKYGTSLPPNMEKDYVGSISKRR